MVKSILAVVAGFVAWTVVFLGGGMGVASANAAKLDPEGFTDDPTTLLMYLVVSMLASVAAGFTTAKIAESMKMRHAQILGGILLVVGLIVQLGEWDRIPVWYNVLFLLLLIPITLMGARLANKSA